MARQIAEYCDALLKLLIQHARLYNVEPIKRGGLVIWLAGTAGWAGRMGNQQRCHLVQNACPHSRDAWRHEFSWQIVSTVSFANARSKVI